jgi:hypothetical protein
MIKMMILVFFANGQSCFWDRYFFPDMAMAAMIPLFLGDFVLFKTCCPVRQNKKVTHETVVLILIFQLNGKRSRFHIWLSVLGLLALIFR